MKKITLLFAGLLFALSVNSQIDNVGIGTTTPNNSAILDVSSTSLGLLVPRMTTAQRNAISSPANSLLVFDTDSVSFWFYDSVSSTWKKIGSGGGGGSGGGTLDNAYDFGGPGAGRIITGDSGPVEINGTGTVTAGKGRLHVTTVGGSIPTPSAAITGEIHTAGSVGFGIGGLVSNSGNPGAAVSAESAGTGQALSATMSGTGSAGSFQVTNAASIYSAVQGSSNGSGSVIFGLNTGTGRAGEFDNTNAANIKETVYISTNASGGYALNVINSAAPGAGQYHAIRAVTQQSASVGVFAGNMNTTGTGIASYGNNQIPQVVASGSGASFVGDATGIFTKFNTGGVGRGIEIQDAYGAGWLVGYWDGGGYRKISGTGTVNTVVEDLGGKKVMLCATESPENLFEDYGSGQLVNGFAHITIDPVFAKNIAVDEKHPLRVIIQPEGDCKGVYVTSKTASGFDVIELDGGKSDISFIYHIAANRKNETRPDGKIARYADERFPNAPVLQKTVDLAGKENINQISKIQQPVLFRRK